MKKLKYMVCYKEEVVCQWTNNNPSMEIISITHGINGYYTVFYYENKEFSTMKDKLKNDGIDE